MSAGVSDEFRKVSEKCSFSAEKVPVRSHGPTDVVPVLFSDADQQLNLVFRTIERRLLKDNAAIDGQ